MRALRWLALALVLATALVWQWRQAAPSGSPAAAQSDAADVVAANTPPIAADTSARASAVDPRAADGADPQPAPSPHAATADTPAAPALPTPAQAREWMRQRQRNMECGTARSDYRTKTRERQEWPWMPPELVASERAAIEAARGRLLEGCPPEIVDEAARKQYSDERQARLEAARRAGDLLARLQPGRIRTPEDRNRARAALYDALLSGDPDLIAQIGRMLDYIQPPDWLASPQAPASFVWRLVACDLGMDCGPGSRVLDLECLSSGGGCGYNHLAESYRDWLPPWQYRLVEQRRAELLARIRSGQIAGLFDPPPRAQAGRGP